MCFHTCHIVAFGNQLFHIFLKNGKFSLNVNKKFVYILKKCLRTSDFIIIITKIRFKFQIIKCSSLFLLKRLRRTNKTQEQFLVWNHLSKSQ